MEKPMPRTGATFTLPSPPNPLIANTLAKAGDMNTTFTDIAGALTGSVAANGATPMTGNLNMNGHNITGVAAITGTAAIASIQELIVTDTMLVGSSGGLGNATIAGTLVVDGQLGAGATDVGSLIIGTVINAADDAAAAGAGVVVGGVYRSGSQLMIRVA
jgi:hypothetical protein